MEKIDINGSTVKLEIIPMLSEEEDKTSFIIEFSVEGDLTGDLVKVGIEYFTKHCDKFELKYFNFFTQDLIFAGYFNKDISEAENIKTDLIKTLKEYFREKHI